ncbi:uncharacterized protein BP01DRAFT_213594 [Aspergillus saccharolyticus JOP 1030-1]|uniref:Uncharacterized protein n=1 Tax=Aspergillus saccharolyticus JOP 1030-1 TaxID=1450539 RepID=A0A319A5J9_9EURO|nr:hypothetical protein BP01DRAFT_213594 [Aspergillus saccharolyticus JOP 1030-1]PYH47338.1 hypothetical protein BP01DRAFT_213594 [Aspergillus saccharolyticus JOP 1030-1]
MTADHNQRACSNSRLNVSDQGLRASHRKLTFIQPTGWSLSHSGPAEAPGGSDDSLMADRGGVYRSHMTERSCGYPAQSCRIAGRGGGGLAGRERRRGWVMMRQQESNTCRRPAARKPRRETIASHSGLSLQASSSLRHDYVADDSNRPGGVGIDVGGKRGENMNGWRLLSRCRIEEKKWIFEMGDWPTMAVAVRFD